ncbi:MAG: NlpC/P60 family protein [Brachybacterium tyrofermentans]|uniref:NlpC/P60 family protein n=1 Tax=Brachybacterium tyrofermentans TaxID=47848 RepID=A0ABW0FK06_9MICO|nr:NlpC/P60 family protein [Brachybacterium tyrofermentans]
MTDQALTTPSRRSFFRGVGIAGAAAVTGVAVPTLLAPSASAAPVPGYNEKITRDRVIERAMFWVDDPRAYSMENFDIGPEEDSDILWRMDCSGFVSMALAVRFDDNPTGLTTETLHPDGGYEISHSISKDDLLPGDFILQKNADSESGVGHVVLFNGWVDGGYNVLEQSYGAGGTTSRTASYPYDDLAHYHPFRYDLIVD